jgi:hypothetical protein
LLLALLLLLLLSVYSLDVGKPFRLSTLELLVSETPVIGGFRLELRVNANGIGVLDLSKSIEIELLSRRKRTL